MIKYVFDNTERLKMVAAGLAVTILVLFVMLTWVRLAGLDGTATPVDPTEIVLPVETSTPEPTSSDLLPPSPEPEGASPTADYGSSAPIALEAVSAFLTGDRAGFARLAQQEAVEGVNEAPVPEGQRITGDVATLLDGPTRQRVQVPTTDGPLILDMIVVNGAWKVLDMRYQR